MRWLVYGHVTVEHSQARDMKSVRREYEKEKKNLLKSFEREDWDDVAAIADHLEELKKSLGKLVNTHGTTCAFRTRKNGQSDKQRCTHDHRNKSGQRANPQAHHHNKSGKLSIVLQMVSLSHADVTTGRNRSLVHQAQALQ